LPNFNVALFYYAGHGLQVNGINYLIPTDAKLEDKSDCKFEAVSVNFIVEEFEKLSDSAQSPQEWTKLKDDFWFTK
jgi:uncharacterized caspase-like protein